MRPEVNSNRLEISNHFEKSFRLHDDFAAVSFQTVVRFYCTCANDLGAIISDNQKKKGVSYDVWIYEKIYNNIRVATYQTSAFKYYQYEPRYKQSNINMCWLSCFISCNVCCFSERASSKNWGRNKELLKIVLLDRNIALDKYKRRLKR